MAEALYEFDPTRDERWPAFVEGHLRSSIFHTVPWLQALRQTYGYEPVAFTTSPPRRELKNALVFCDIRSWLTGSRLVSLPFSDHCDPLCESAEDMSALIRSVQTALGSQNWKYVEIRPTTRSFGHTVGATGFRPAMTYILHTLSLRPDLRELFGTLHKDSVQRRIQRAERAGLEEKCGISAHVLEQFYALFVITRRRHCLPPIPFAWFKNLILCLSEGLEIRLACKGKTPIAAILTLRFRDVIYYKYGCSDARFHKYGAIPWLLWRTMVDGRWKGANELDMGRTEEGNMGLLTFKNHWTASSKPLIYWRFPQVISIDSPKNWKLKLAKPIFSSMPLSLLTIAGRLGYRHIG